MSEEVDIRIEGAVGRLTLTRPQALHALTLSMCHAMITALQGWRDDPRVELILIDHEGGRGFCAGGDIRALSDSVAGDGVLARDFFRVEYQLDHLLFTYPKPVVSVIDGIVMGGGVGIALPARYRIATERTTFAMPEAGIGLFPDVGAAWYLSRLPGKAGLWLALTGARIKAADCLTLGIATHFAKSDDLESLKAAIIASPGEIEAILARFEGDAGPDSVTARAAERDRLFGGASVHEVVQALRADGRDWAVAQYEAIAGKSPMMLAVAYREMQIGARFTDFADDLEMEYALSMRTIFRPDFLEGVRATVIDKDGAPHWDPPHLRDVTPAMVDAMFEPLPPDQRWTPLP